LANGRSCIDGQEPGCAREFANEHLFAPIGIDETPLEAPDGANRWPRDPQGNSLGGWGLVLKPREMARFGLLYLKDLVVAIASRPGGQWRDRWLPMENFMIPAVL
jgi:CubicO group peptidase (beta-lactamase class C family)